MSAASHHRATAAQLPTPWEARTTGLKPWEMGGSGLESESGEHSDESEIVGRLSGDLSALRFYLLGLYVRHSSHEMHRC